MTWGELRELDQDEIDFLFEEAEEINNENQREADRARRGRRGS